MFKKLQSVIRRRREMTRRNRLIFALFMSLALGVLVFSFFLSLAPGRISLFGQNPDWHGAVPTGWSVPAAAVASLSDADLPSYVIGYANGAENGVALLVWDKETSRYRMTSQLPLAALDDRLGAVTKVAAYSLGEGASPAATVIAKDGEAGYGQFYVVRTGNSLRTVMMVDGGGTVKPAVFRYGVLPDGQATFELADVNVDGRLEALVRGRYMNLTGSAGTWNSADVYVWRNGRFEYDKDLSWAMTTDMTMFPEPDRKPVDEAEPKP